MQTFVTKYSDWASPTDSAPVQNGLGLKDLAVTSYKSSIRKSDANKCVYMHMNRLEPELKKLSLKHSGPHKQSQTWRVLYNMCVLLSHRPEEQLISIFCTFSSYNSHSNSTKSLRSQAAAEHILLQWFVREHTLHFACLLACCCRLHCLKLPTTVPYLENCYKQNRVYHVRCPAMVVILGCPCLNRPTGSPPPYRRPTNGFAVAAGGHNHRWWQSMKRFRWLVPNDAAWNRRRRRRPDLRRHHRRCECHRSMLVNW